VTVPVLLTSNAAIVLPAVVKVPVPTMIGANPVNVPPELSVKLLKVNDVEPGLNAVVPKSSLLKNPVLVSVCTAVPDPVNVKLTPLAIVPLLEAQLNVRVILAAAVKPPVPVKEKLVAVVIARLTVPAVVCANMMLLVPNAIERVLVLLELNIPVVRSLPFKSKVPEVNVVVAVAALNVNGPDNVVVPLGQLTVSLEIDLPLHVIVPVLTVVTVNAVNVPPELNVRVPTFNDVVPRLNAVVPKFNAPNQLAVVSVCIAVPDPVNVKLGALVALPPAVSPNVNVLVTDASDTNPPIPVKVNPVASDMSRLT